MTHCGFFCVFELTQYFFLIIIIINQSLTLPLLNSVSLCSLFKTHYSLQLRDPTAESGVKWHEDET